MSQGFVDVVTEAVVKTYVEPAFGSRSLHMLLGGVQFTEGAGLCLARILLMRKSVGARWKWVDIGMFVKLLPLHVAFFVGMLCTRVDRYGAPHPFVDLWVSICSGVRCSLVRVVRGGGLGVQVSYNIAHAVPNDNLKASRAKKEE